MLNEELFKTIFEDKNREAFNNFLDAFKSKVIEETLCLMPAIIASLSIKTKGLDILYTDFFKAHPELADKKDTVANIVMALEMEDGSRNLEDILKLVPERIDMLNKLQGIKPELSMSVARENTNGFI